MTRWKLPFVGENVRTAGESGDERYRKLYSPTIWEADKKWTKHGVTLSVGLRRAPARRRRDRYGPALRSRARGVRANGELAQPIVEAMCGFDFAATEGRTIEVTTTCARPVALPADFASGRLDE